MTDPDLDFPQPFSAQAAKPHTGLVGAFSTQSVEKVGTGTTQRKVVQKTYWYAKELEGGSVEVQPLNGKYVPAGIKEHMDKDAFLQRFSPEPEFYQKTVFPKMKELNTTVMRAEELRAKGAMYSAEFEYQNALAVDAENVKANFGLGLTYLARGESNKANDLFERLVHLDAAFEEEHKHLFNEFGISLRKSGMLDQAVVYYGRALEMTTEDENLYYNMARAYFEKGDIGGCVENLKSALRINPSHPQVVEFLAYLKKNNFPLSGPPRAAG